jgi:hypothetical protein
MWHDLLHLRVEATDISPNYATDGTLLAYAVTGEGVSGRSVFQSTDRGMSWTLVMTSYTTFLDTLREEAAHLLPTIEGAFSSSFPQLDWDAIELPPETRENSIMTRFSPTFDDDHTIYLLDQYNGNLYRSTNEGNSWERWPGQLTMSDKVSAFEISPMLEDDNHQVFVLTESGKFLVENSGGK